MVPIRGSQTVFYLASEVFQTGNHQAQLGLAICFIG
jgi:hypothetical protein